MTKEEAFKTAKNKGVKITHGYFSFDEWLKVSPDGQTLTFEDGVKMSIRDFFTLRMSKGWSEGWEIKKRLRKVWRKLKV